MGSHGIVVYDSIAYLSVFLDPQELWSRCCHTDGL
jgi:hypothetical protein